MRTINLFNFDCIQFSLFTLLMDKAIVNIKLFKQVISNPLQTLYVACIFFFLVRSFFFVAATKKKNEQRNYNIQNKVGE